jgi:hypothetical protein
MWMSDGRKLTGDYGTWRGREVELGARTPCGGEHELIQDGGERPGPEWDEVVYPNRFARTPYHYYRRVPETEVSQTHGIVTTGELAFTDDRGYDYTTQVRIIAQDEAGRLAVETAKPGPAVYWGPLRRVFGFEEYDRSWMFGWVPGDRVTDLRIERRH